MFTVRCTLFFSLAAEDGASTEQAVPPVAVSAALVPPVTVAPSAACVAPTTTSVAASQVIDGSPQANGTSHSYQLLFIRFTHSCYVDVSSC